MEKELFEACRIGDLTKVNELIKLGVDVNNKLHGFFPLLLSISLSNKDLCELLIKNGADVNAYIESYNESLLLNILKGKRIKNQIDFEIVKLLIKKGANVNTRDKYDDTPLSFTSCYGYKEICELLIENGADINSKNDFEFTPLIIAANNKHKDIAEILLSNNANIDDIAFNTMLENGWIDLCLKVINDKAFDKRKHLLESYYSYSY